MENYVVSARKYRPATFASVVGQKALTATLKNAIATDRLAHAYLFCGSRGVGKTSCARIFAKSINCSNPTPDGDPCNECDSCRAFNENRSLNIIELDAASNNGVDDIRELVDQVQVPPTNGRYRVFIIDEVHMLSSAAFNAFLKTLEEPPSYVIFILATTEKQKIIPTILSRCQIYDFNRITVADIVDHLEYVASQEGITTERQALNIIAAKADGAMRDALSIFDQVAASSRGNITYASTIENLNVLDSAYYNRLMEAFLAQDVTSALLIYKEIRDRGFDSHFFINGLAAYLRDLMVASDKRSLALLDADDAVKEQMAQMASRCQVDFFYAAMSLCNEADLNYRDASSKTFLVELLLIRLCQQLGPSPTCSGDGEGQLKPLAAQPTAIGFQAPAAGSRETPARPSLQPPQSESQSRPAASESAPAVNIAVSAAPPPPPRNAATLKNAKVLRSTRSVLNDGAATSRSAQSTPSAHRNARAEAFSIETILEAWDEFARENSRETVLSNTMRACRPTLAGQTQLHVVVENEIQVQKIDEWKPRILQRLRDAAQNDSITIATSINESGPKPEIWNDREILHHLTSTSPTLVKMINEMRFKLL